jgi:hypothetical protein
MPPISTVFTIFTTFTTPWEVLVLRSELLRRVAVKMAAVRLRTPWSP